MLSEHKKKLGAAAKKSCGLNNNIFISLIADGIKLFCIKNWSLVFKLYKWFIKMYDE